jgi:hypothetical protein
MEYLKGKGCQNCGIPSNKEMLEAIRILTLVYNQPGGITSNERHSFLVVMDALESLTHYPVAHGAH